MLADYYSIAVEHFHHAFKHPINLSGRPAIPADIGLRSLRTELITEEYCELLVADEANDLVGIADALGDLLYVIHGMALTYGIPMLDVFTEIHHSNMSKLDADNKPILREDGKILKGPYYHPPDIAGLFAELEEQLIDS